MEWSERAKKAEQNLRKKKFFRKAKTNRVEVGQYKYVVIARHTTRCKCLMMDRTVAAMVDSRTIKTIRDTSLTYEYPFGRRCQSTTTVYFCFVRASLPLHFSRYVLHCITSHTSGPLVPAVCAEKLDAWQFFLHFFGHVLPRIACTNSLETIEFRFDSTRMTG